MDRYRFDSVARSERYFTATLLSHLLMAQDFLGLQAIFDALSIVPSRASNSDNFELISELDPLRDGSTQNERIRNLFQEHGRLAVPDLFLRWNDQLLIVEAKFFTSPNDDDCVEQIRAQKKAIELVLPETAYATSNISYAVLIVQRTSGLKSLPGDIRFITWSDLIVSLSEAFSGRETPDVSYCFDVLRRAEQRARKELEKPEWTHKRITNLQALLSGLPKLVEENLIYVGFKGGERRLMQASLEELEQRDHYKLSDVRWSSNWLRVDLLIGRYLSLKIAAENLQD
ncbi:MAG: hypothetical protein GY737_21960 [Desulfobacteraceae bacterium]|nr:hypothetical protein [Desulfobacteraceae bacterium]